jgi:hypothetical protein
MSWRIIESNWMLGQIAEFLDSLPRRGPSSKKQRMYLYRSEFPCQTLEGNLIDQLYYRRRITKKYSLQSNQLTTFPGCGVKRQEHPAIYKYKYYYAIATRAVLVFVRGHIVVENGHTIRRRRRRVKGFGFIFLS